MRNVSFILICTATLAVTSTSAQAADIAVDSGTFLGIAAREVSGSSKETLFPLTQFVGLAADKMADGNLSLHFHGWGRADLADKSYNNDISSGNLTYAYLHYRLNPSATAIRAGRHFIREGIINEQIDGVSFRADLPMGFGLSAFGGATVHTAALRGESGDGKGDLLYGGRANYRYKGLLEAGISGVYESTAPALVNQASGNYRRVGGDLWLTPHKSLDIIGQSSYNPETARFSAHSYLLSIKPVQKLVLTGDFNQYSDRSYLGAWKSFTASTFADIALNDKSSSLGLNASYTFSKNFEISADYKHYTREAGTAARFGGMARLNNLDSSIRGGVGYHYLNAGEGFAIGAAPSASYHELRCYVMREAKNYFGAIDIVADFFKDKIYGKNSAWEATTSLGYHFTQGVSLSGEIGFGMNPQYTEEAKALLRLTYNMVRSASGGKK